MASFRLKRKTFADVKGFNEGTFRGLMNDTSSEGKAKLAAYERKYATDVSNYRQKTALSKIQNVVNSQNNKSNLGKSSVGIKQGAINTWNRMGTMGKIGTGAAVAGGLYFLGKGLFGGNTPKNTSSSTY